MSAGHKNSAVRPGLSSHRSHLLSQKVQGGIGSNALRQVRQLHVAAPRLLRRAPRSLGQPREEKLRRLQKCMQPDKEQLGFRKCERVRRSSLLGASESDTILPVKRTVCHDAPDNRLKLYCVHTNASCATMIDGGHRAVVTTAPLSIQNLPRTLFGHVNQLCRSWRCESFETNRCRQCNVTLIRHKITMKQFSPWQSWQGHPH